MKIKAATNSKLTYFVKVLLIALAGASSAIKAHADCQPQGDGNQWPGTAAAQVFQTGLDYLKNVQNVDVLHLIPHVDLDIKPSGTTWACMDNSNTCGSGGPTPCGTKYKAKLDITGSIKGDLPTALGKSFDIPVHLGLWTVEVLGNAGINFAVDANLTGSGSYTSSCQNAVSTTEGVSGGANADITGGAEVSVEWYRGTGSHYQSGSQEGIGGDVEQSIGFTYACQWSQGGGDTFNKFCVGEIRPKINFILPKIGHWGGSWSLTWPYALYDGTPGC